MNNVTAVCLLCSVNGYVGLAGQKASVERRSLRKRHYDSRAGKCDMDSGRHSRQQPVRNWLLSFLAALDSPITQLNRPKSSVRREAVTPGTAGDGAEQPRQKYFVTITGTKVSMIKFAE